MAAQPLNDLGHRRQEAHVVAGAAREELGGRQGRHEPCRRAWIPVERRVRDAHLDHAVRVRHGDPGQTVLGGIGGGPGIAVADHHARVVDLDPVHRRFEGAPGQGLQQRSTIAVEWMRDADQAALLAHGSDRLGHRQPARHGALDVQRDEITLERPDLLADDHGEVRSVSPCRLAGLQRSVDRLVVGDGQVRQAARRRGADDGRRRGQAVEARAGVAMEVHEGAAAVLTAGDRHPARSLAPGTS